MPNWCAWCAPGSRALISRPVAPGAPAPLLHYLPAARARQLVHDRSIWAAPSRAGAGRRLVAAYCQLIAQSAGRLLGSAHSILPLSLLSFSLSLAFLLGPLVGTKPDNLLSWEGPSAHDVYHSIGRYLARLADDDNEFAVVVATGAGVRSSCSSPILGPATSHPAPLT